ncbi:disulfide bond formation protein B [Thiotrichales bacterium 19S3-7]|nr:disulfide bond formation protein B [Thiotrichales bacterium 19S3-7]MCF6802110.1 disulfide bond formation protein B [Thiotrichales bacterium 19S3-11]
MTEKGKIRAFYLICFIIATASIVSAIYFQLAKNLIPCPLCIMQRIAYLFVAILSLIALLQAPISKKANLIYLILLILSTAFGLYIAIRQVYLEYYPSTEAHGCGVGIGYLFYNMPFKDFLLLMFNGSGDCSTVSWTFLKLSMAFWSMIVFLVLMILYFLGAMHHISRFKKTKLNKEEGC